MHGHATTLRIKLVVSDGDGCEAAHNAFAELSEIHRDQAIFQVNETQYVADDGWGFKITYETPVYSREEFVRSASLPDIERAIVAVAPDSFKRRILAADERG
ncbi:hypothetical protein DP107_13865 [Haloglomus irregulare]|jgi:hypothetical protein|uniref:Uncharacterized protein n=1 Tax=Haloglomus irregulare TaxID=2234134 RepID=A0A554MX92_9EURY|nr:hypothetical protein [Haloglomus irregulare]TSD09747.1 hypothetical protein DP107_13865 [Haloglomus irregulare]